MAWLDFIICLFLGYLGIHKFKEKKIGMGILYLCTFGLFGFGWIYDCVKYVLIALNANHTTDSPTTQASITNGAELPDQSHKILDVLKKIGLWYVTVLFLTLALAFFPSFASLCAIIIAAFVLPIQKWQDLLNKHLKMKGTVKIISIIILAVLTFIAVPNRNTQNDAVIPTISIDSTTAQTTVASEETAEATADTTIAATTEATTEPSTTPTTIPTTEPSTEATTAPVHTHDYQAATCTQPEICSSCGATTGSATGHSWKAATCTSPQVCSTCGTTSGTAKGHNYTDGKCSSCGGSDPNYSGTLVWIPTKGGTKYHTHSGCSNMDDPIQVTEEEAEARGFTPCKRCH